MTSQQRSTRSSLKHLKSILWQCFIRICCVNPFSGEFVQLHWSQINFSKLVSVLEALAASPLTITASFSAADCSLSEKESSRLIVSSASTLTNWKCQSQKLLYSLISEYFQHTQQVQFPLLTQVGVVSLTFTVSSEVSPISTATLAAALLSLQLSFLAPAPLLGPWWPLPTVSGVLFLDIGVVWHP